MLVHYYKTKCEVSGEDAPLNFLAGLYRIQNDRKSSIIYLDWPYIGFNGGYILKKLDSIKFKMAVYWTLFTFTWPIFGKPC